MTTPKLFFFAVACMSNPGLLFAATSVNQYGITWTFDTDYEIGQYVNGDYYVIENIGGEGVKVINISMPNAQLGHDGSMIDPIPDMQIHGYDDRISGYEPSLNASERLPNLVINSGSSLVSTISRDIASNRARPVLEVAAILTVVQSHPPPGSFRPSYAGPKKVTDVTTEHIDYNLLLSLDPVPSTPTVSSLSALIEKPWIDHRLEWQGDYLHPEQNMENYGAGMARDAHDIALRLLLNDSLSAKKTLLHRFIQLGLDNYGLVLNGAEWGDVGGSIGVGRKLPILFAALLLDHWKMKSIAFDYDSRLVFQEDGQTFFLTQEEKDATYDPANCNAGTAYCNEGWYDSMTLFSARWGERHRKWQTSSYSFLPGKNGYREITHESTLGAALVVKLLAIESLWNHDPFLNWQENMVNEGINGSWGSNFARDMWARYYNFQMNTTIPADPGLIPADPGLLKIIQN